MTTSTTSKKPRRQTSYYLRNLLKLAKSQWKTLFLATFFLAISASASLTYPQAIRVIMDEAIGSKDTEMIDKAALFMGIVFVIQSITGALRYYLFTVAGERILADLRQNLFKRIIAQEVAFFDTRKTGELLNRLASDTSVLQNAVSVNISGALRHLATVVGGLGLLFYTSTKLCAIQ